MNLSEWLFWDVDKHQISFEEHSNFIIRRVLQKGLLSDWKAIKRYYGDLLILEKVKEMRDLDDKTLNFLSVYFDIPLDQFRCYTERQLRDPHWSY